MLENFGKSIREIDQLALEADLAGLVQETRAQFTGFQLFAERAVFE